MASRCFCEGVVRLSASLLTQQETADGVTSAASASAVSFTPFACDQRRMRSPTSEVLRFTVAFKYDSTEHVKTYSRVRMLPSLFDMVRQKRPQGRMWPVDEDWKKDIQVRMTETGISRADLARLIREQGVTCTPSAITILFRKETKQSRLVPCIHKALELANTTTPAQAITKDDAFRRLQRVWRELTGEQREHLAATGELLAIKR
jgi:hypothetical protein